MIKVIANTAVLDGDHDQQSYRYVRIVNTHATSVANVEIGMLQHVSLLQLLEGAQNEASNRTD